MFFEAPVENEFNHRFQIEFRFVSIFCHVDMDRFMVV